MLREIQDEIVELLQADPYFADIPGILTQDKGDIENEIERSLAVFTPGTGKIGLAIIVVVPMAKMLAANVSEFEITPVIRVLEQVTLNRDPVQGIGKSYMDVAEKVFATLHGRKLESTQGALWCRDGLLIGDDPDRPSYDVPLVTEGVILYGPGDGRKPATVADPGISILGGEVREVSCETAGAVIYTTIDGTRPTPANHLVLALPYTIAVGVTVAARAYKTGMRASEIVKQTA